ncbi:ArsR family transcriptional regulator [Erwinia rhapontici]|uniref:ArsR family transcriptional regulator n=1 Tax=Erwinia rhapontici TaxID=55212 RepID=UPI0013313140|nr:ArsR family transcriptional regulator [Erwinia rhapontici]MBP2157437.1 DNA-binding transcriptional ArsR family regulator [Erwinia rhapontici]
MNKPWVRMPSEWIREKGLVNLRWTDAESPRSHKVAALQLYIAISLTSEDKLWHLGEYDLLSTSRIYASAETYTSLMHMTGLSRALISGGLEVLKKHKIIEVIVDGRRNLYQILGYNGLNGWCKLPQRALFRADGTIAGFHSLTKRNKYELYALKLWLYMLQVRDNVSPSIKASYEKINEGTGVPEKEIPRAYGLLLSMGLLTRVAKEADDDGDLRKTANAYYPLGYKDFFVGRNVPVNEPAIAAEKR